VELVGDLGDGGCDDGHVQCDEEDGEDQGDDDHSKLVRGGVICGGYSAELFRPVVVVMVGRDLLRLMVRY